MGKKVSHYHRGVESVDLHLDELPGPTSYTEQHPRRKSHANNTDLSFLLLPLPPQYTPDSLTEYHTRYSKPGSSP